MLTGPQGPGCHSTNTLLKGKCRRSHRRAGNVNRGACGRRVPSRRCRGSGLLASSGRSSASPPVLLSHFLTPPATSDTSPRRAACSRPAMRRSRGSAEGATGQRPGHHALRSLSPASPRRDGGCLASGHLARGGGTSPARRNARRLPQATTEGGTSLKSQLHMHARGATALMRVPVGHTK